MWEAYLLLASALCGNSDRARTVLQRSRRPCANARRVREHISGFKIAGNGELCGGVPQLGSPRCPAASARGTHRSRLLSSDSVCAGACPKRRTLGHTNVVMFTIFQCWRTTTRQAKTQPRPPGVVESKELPESIIRRTDQSHKRLCVHQPDRRGEVRVHLPGHLKTKDMRTFGMHHCFRSFVFCSFVPSKLTCTSASCWVQLREKWTTTKGAQMWENSAKSASGKW